MQVQFIWVGVERRCQFLCCKTFWRFPHHTDTECVTCHYLFLKIALTLKSDIEAVWMIQMVCGVFYKVIFFRCPMSPGIMPQKSIANRNGNKSVKSFCFLGVVNTCLEFNRCSKQPNNNKSFPEFKSRWWNKILKLNKNHWPTFCSLSYMLFFRINCWSLITVYIKEGCHVDFNDHAHQMCINYCIFQL